MDRMDLDAAYAPLEPVTWPGGGEQAVKRLTWRQEELVADLTTADEATARAIIPKIMVAILPGRTWDEIADTLDSQTMRDLIIYASREYQRACKEMERMAGNAVAGTAPASPPPTPAAVSSHTLLEPTAVPCGVL